MHPPLGVNDTLRSEVQEPEVGRRQIASALGVPFSTKTQVPVLEFEGGAKLGASDGVSQSPHKQLSGAGCPVEVVPVEHC